MRASYSSSVGPLPSLTADFLRLDAGHVAGDVHFQNDRHVGVDRFHAGRGAAQAHFFHARCATP